MGTRSVSLRTRVCLFLGVNPGQIPGAGYVQPTELLDDRLFDAAVQAHYEKTDDYWDAIANVGQRPGNAPPFIEIAWIYSHLKERRG